MLEKMVQNIKPIKIGNKTIGDNYPCFIIAEAGANWRISEDMNKNWEQALKLIDIAVEADADIVKFQVYRAGKMYTKEAGYADYIGKKKAIFDIIKEMELPYEWLPKLKAYCDQKNIMFFASPFDEQSTDKLEKVGVVAHKIPSYTISHIPLLKHIARTGKPIIMSTGAANSKDVQKAIDAIRSEGNNQIALMQCTAKYPAPLSTINLRTIPKFKEQFNVPVGLSDHSRDPYIAPLGAIALGANIYEVHYTTDNNLPGPDHGFAILGEELIDLVKKIRQMESALGTSEKEVQEAEQELYDFCRRRIYASTNIKSGEKISEENTVILRPGKQVKGIGAEDFDKIKGKVINSDIKEGQPITENLIN